MYMLVRQETETTGFVWIAPTFKESYQTSDFHTSPRVFNHTDTYDATCITFTRVLSFLLPLSLSLSFSLSLFLLYFLQFYYTNIHRCYIR